MNVSLKKVLLPLLEEHGLVCLNTNQWMLEFGTPDENFSVTYEILSKQSLHGPFKQLRVLIAVKNNGGWSHWNVEHLDPPIPNSVMYFEDVLSFQKEISAVNNWFFLHILPQLREYVRYFVKIQPEYYSFLAEKHDILAKEFIETYHPKADTFDEGLSWCEGWLRAQIPQRAEDRQKELVDHFETYAAFASYYGQMISSYNRAKWSWWHTNSDASSGKGRFRTNADEITEVFILDTFNQNGALDDSFDLLDIVFGFWNEFSYLTEHGLISRYVFHFSFIKN